MFLFIYLFFNFFLTLFIFETERYRAWTGRSRERGRHRIWSRLQALSCQHRAWCGAWTQELRDHDLSWSQTLNWLSHPGALLSLLSQFLWYLYCVLLTAQVDSNSCQWAEVGNHLLSLYYDWKTTWWSQQFSIILGRALIIGLSRFAPLTLSGKNQVHASIS